MPTSKTSAPRRRKPAAKRARRSSIDAFLALPDDEKERIWESYNRPVPFDETRPLTAAERRQWERAKGRGRPRVGQGAKQVSVTIEGGLLARADRYAQDHGLTRARLIAVALDSHLTRFEDDQSVTR